MAPEQDLIKQELLYAREIRRTFERAIAGINPLKKVILSRIGKGAAIKTRIQKKTREIYLLGKGNATTDLRQSLKILSAAKIEDEILLGPFEDELVDAYTTETLGYMDYFAKDLQDEFNITLREGYMLGESIPELSKRIADTWKVNKVRATRFARTQTNEVYNAAHTVTYLTEPAIENIQFMAHLDSRTSAICRFYDGTIWRKDDPSIQRPPLHFNCRSRIVAYPYDYPGDRDFTKQTDGTKVTKKYGKSIDAQVTNFRTKYWKPAKVEIPDDLIAKGLTTGLPDDITMEQREYLLSHDDTRERLRLLDEDGKIVAENVGDEATGMVTVPSHKAAHDKNRSFTIHHNHPDGGPISEGDLRELSNWDGIDTIWAHGDKTSYKVTIGKNTSRHDLWLESKTIYGNKFDKVYDYAYDNDLKMDDITELLFKAADEALEDLHKKGIIQYEKFEIKTAITTKHPVSAKNQLIYPEERIKALDYPVDKEEIRDRYFDTVIKPDLNLDIDVADSVEKYTGNDYRLFNTYLRDPKASLSEYGPVIDYEDMIEGAIKNIDSIMDRVSLDKDMIMHRGITPNRAEALLKSWQMTDAAYGSTSESIGTALHFTTKGSIDLESKAFQNIIVIQGKKGSKGIHYGGGESEIILPRGTTYTVTGTREVEELSFKTRFGGGGTLPIRFIYCMIT